MPRKLTAADVCEVTKYSRQEFRLIVNALAYYRDQKPPPRKAREFTRQDLIVLSVVRMLEVEYGLRRDAIAKVFELLRTALSGPKRLNSEAHLQIMLSPPRVIYKESPEKISAGILVPLLSVFDRVDHYLGSYPEQRDLSLHTALVSDQKKSKTA